MIRGLVAVATAIAVTTSAGGCGAEDESAPGSSATTLSSTPVRAAPGLTKHEFLAHVNDLCQRKWHFILHAFREYRGDLGSTEPALSNRQRYAKAARLAYLPSLNFHIFDHVRSLGAPPGEEVEVEEVITKMQYAIRRGGQMQPATHRAQFETLFADYNHAAGAYGLDECLATWQRLPHGEA